MDLRAIKMLLVIVAILPDGNFLDYPGFRIEVKGWDERDSILIAN